MKKFRRLQFYDEILFHPTMPFERKRIALLIMSYLDGRQTYVGIPRLAKDAHLTVGVATKHVKALVAEGYLRIGTDEIGRPTLWPTNKSAPPVCSVRTGKNRELFRRRQRYCNEVLKLKISASACLLYSAAAYMADPKTLECREGLYEIGRLVGMSESTAKRGAAELTAIGSL